MLPDLSKQTVWFQNIYCFGKTKSYLAESIQKTMPHFGPKQHQKSLLINMGFCCLRVGFGGQQVSTGQKDNDIKVARTLCLVAALKTSTEDGAVVQAFVPKHAK